MFFFIYIIFILICAFFWLGTKPFQPRKTKKNVSLSLVVCCKNEEKSLPLLLSSIEAQIADIKNIIFANDKSDDLTLDILNSFSEKYANVKVITANGTGKKNALRQAIQLSDNEYILCIDADCVVPKNYFLLVNNFLSENQPDLMIGGVKYVNTDVLFKKLQALEFSSLIASGAGAALARFPIMCNGANLAFRREVWQQAQNHLFDEELSGDDVFLLHFVKKIKGKIMFLKAKEGFTWTFPADSCRKFLDQRKRWASKSPSYTDWQTILAAITVFLINLEIITLGIISVFIPFIKWIFIAMFCFKIIIDSVLLIPFLIFSDQKKLTPLIPLLSIIYPFYIAVVPVLGIFGKFGWKN
ncbi:MAG: glycosyltransferase [Prevotellaceae bacterium]|jgi:cellulose synthase/poly-beta-1,6-N-acetylglucosamine synthase-like glycosyltransferase|nr:glycosyltransferase [Prevotellaceae bacterium]